MTDDTTNSDRTDLEEHPQAGSADAQREGVETSRRRFMQGAAGSIAAAGALGALGDTAAAAGEERRVVLIGRGPGKHTYSVEVSDGGDVQLAEHTDRTDSVASTTDGAVASGELWNWFVDVLKVSGEIERIEADGQLSVHFPDGAFENATELTVTGESDGLHDYVIGTDHGDIDPGARAEGGDVDLGGRGSEAEWTSDAVEGTVKDEYVDGFDVSSNQTVDYLHVDGGHLSVTPTRATRAHATADAKEASLVFFYMGDGAFTTFFQNFIALNQAVKGYDRSILLKHDNQEDGMSGRAHNNADEVLQPTRDNFEDSLQALVDGGYEIDLYIVSHGDRGSFKMSNGDFGSEDWYSAGDVHRFRRQFDEDLPLRMVYQANCWGNQLNSAWQALGADAAAGSRYVNFFPNQFQKFARNWRNGDTFEQAIRDSNTSTSQQLVKQFLKADAGATENQQWAQNRTCTQWSVWLGKGQCAKDYFVDRWLHTEKEWNSVDVNGWNFVRYASKKLIGGNPNVTR